MIARPRKLKETVCSASGCLANDLSGKCACSKSREAVCWPVWLCHDHFWNHGTCEQCFIKSGEKRSVSAVEEQEEHDYLKLDRKPRKGKKSSAVFKKGSKAKEKKASDDSKHVPVTDVLSSVKCRICKVRPCYDRSLSDISLPAGFCSDCVIGAQNTSSEDYSDSEKNGCGRDAETSIASEGAGGGVDSVQDSESTFTGAMEVAGSVTAAVINSGSFDSAVDFLKDYSGSEEDDASLCGYDAETSIASEGAGGGLDTVQDSESNFSSAMEVDGSVAAAVINSGSFASAVELVKIDSDRDDDVSVCAETSIASEGAVDTEQDSESTFTGAMEVDGSVAAVINSGSFASAVELVKIDSDREDDVSVCAETSIASEGAGGGVDSVQDSESAVDASGGAAEVVILDNDGGDLSMDLDNETPNVYSVCGRPFKRQCKIDCVALYELVHGDADAVEGTDFKGLICVNKKGQKCKYKKYYFSKRDFDLTSSDEACDVVCFKNGNQMVAVAAGSCSYNKQSVILAIHIKPSGKVFLIVLKFDEEDSCDDKVIEVPIALFDHYSYMISLSELGAAKAQAAYKRLYVCKETNSHGCQTRKRLASIVTPTIPPVVATTPKKAKVDAARSGVESTTKKRLAPLERKIKLLNRNNEDLAEKYDKLKSDLKSEGCLAKVRERKISESTEEADQARRETDQARRETKEMASELARMKVQKPLSTVEQSAAVLLESSSAPIFNNSQASVHNLFNVTGGTFNFN
jgi:hypothetical protein